MNKENLYAVSIFSKEVAMAHPRLLLAGKFLDNGFFEDSDGGLWSHAVLATEEEVVSIDQVYAVSDLDRETALRQRQIRETGKFLPDGQFKADSDGGVWRCAVPVSGGL